MKKLSKNDLAKTASDLMAKGYKILHATDDGQFFTDRELASANAKKIGSEVFIFAREVFANAGIATEDKQPEPDSGNASGADKKPQAQAAKKPAQSKKTVSKPKKK